VHGLVEAASAAKNAATVRSHANGAGQGASQMNANFPPLLLLDSTGLLTVPWVRRLLPHPILQVAQVSQSSVVRLHLHPLPMSHQVKRGTKVPFICSQD
jgi:hypothetical protein